MDMLLRAGVVATAGLVLAELRQGCRTPAEAKTLLARLAALPYLEVDRENWLGAGQMVADGRGRGCQLEIADCLLSALALREKCWFFTLDHDFERIPGLQLYATK